MCATRRHREFDIKSLPYMIKIYVNYQVLIPAQLIRSLGLKSFKYASIVFEYNNREIAIEKVKLLRTKKATSRQFTIPKIIRKKYNIKTGSIIKVKLIKPIG